MMTHYHCPWNRLLILLLVAGMILTVPPSIGMASTRTNVMRQIRLQDAPRKIYLQLAHRSRYKIIQVNPREVLIALKDVEIADTLERRGSAASYIRKLRIERLQDNVTMLVIRTAVKLKKTTADWDRSSSSLVVSFYIDRPVQKKRKRLKQKPKGHYSVYTAPQPDITEKDLPVEEVVFSKPPKLSGGSMDDILETISEGRCIQKKAIRSARDLAREKKWDQAEALLSDFIETDTGESCQDAAMFLKAYCAYQLHGQGQEEEVLQAITTGQDAVNFFPSSPYLPYGMAILGRLYRKLDNTAEAKGYFEMVLKKYPAYRGTPEIYFQLGMLAAQKGDHRSAIARFENILKQYPTCELVPETRLQIGKELYKMNRFSNALDQLSILVKNYPKKIYDSPEALLFIGNSYYHTGKRKEARITLEKVYNLYPDIETNHIVLTRIADILTNENQVEKAKKLYQLVIDRFPGSDGFVISSIRMAGYLESREEKEKIYDLIIEDYPEHPMASLARLRIAEIQNKAGEYKQAIDTLNELFRENPRALKKEAIFLQQDSYESYFKWIIENGNYPMVLSLYEKERRSLDTYENPELFSLVGEAYFKGHLYENAAKLLQEADSYANKNKQPTQYTYMLGVALHETGDLEKAAEQLQRYVKAYPDSEYTADAWRRIARIHRKNKVIASASAEYRTAFQKSRKDSEQAAILIEHASLYEQTRRYEKSTPLLVNAINLLSPLPETDKKMMAQAYRELGKSYLFRSDFIQAADAFSMALKFSEDEKDRIGLNFLLGESYNKAKRFPQASQAYQNVVSAGDAFWSKLAGEKLKDLQLTRKMNKT